MSEQEQAGASGFDDTMVGAIWTVAAAAAVLAVGALIAFGGRSGLGVALGGGLATANLVVFAMVVRGMLRGGRRGRLWAAAGLLKLAGLMGIAWLLLKTGAASGLQLAIGYGALPLGITAASMIRPKGER